MALKQYLLVTIIVLLSACGGGGSSSGGGGDVGAFEQLTKIVALGDSIGARSPNWPSVVGSRIATPVANYSRDSQSTTDFVGRVDSILDSEKPSHLLILLGTNDARQGNVGGAIANLQIMVNAASVRGIVAVVGTIPPNYASSFANQNASEISNGIRGLSDARIAPVRLELGNNASYFPDGLHPNSAGTEAIARAFLAVL